MVHVPHKAVNRAETFWGSDAKRFNPNRWLDGSISQHRASEILGYRHSLTFIDGPRACLGKIFALTEIKVRYILWVTYAFPYRLFHRSCCLSYYGITHSNFLTGLRRKSSGSLACCSAQKWPVRRDLRFL